MKPENSIFDEGYQAHLDGKTRGENPYHEFFDSEEFTLWNTGWDDAEKEVENEGN